VRIESVFAGSPLHAVCERTSGDPKVIAWSLTGARTAAHQHALGFRDETWVLLKCIDATEGDAVYRDSVLKAAEWSVR
jgi:hypothetical protein